MFLNCRLSIRTIACVSCIFLLIFFTNSLKAQSDNPLIDSVNAIIADSILAEKTPAPPTNVSVADLPDDHGGSVIIKWDLSVDDNGPKKVKIYDVLRAEEIDGKLSEFLTIGDVTSGQNQFIDGSTDDNKFYYYKIQAVNIWYNEKVELQKNFSESDPAGPINSTAQWFNFQRINTFVGTIFLCFFILYYINLAKSGKDLFIRKLAGMEAVHEAVGRATEMGRKIFYIPGIGDMDNMQTIAAMTILGRVAELTAEYETYLDVPVSRSLVMVTAREVVKEAYSKTGRPDSFKEDQVHYLTDDQFGYAAAVDGMFVREEPATIFFMGQFYAESLILAETGNSIGAIQIAGTAMPSQLPFFVAACDYTLIGEELFAASAYLSKEPKLLGSLKGQDIGKGFILLALLVGIILESFGMFQFSNLFRVIGN